MTAVALAISRGTTRLRVVWPNSTAIETIFLRLLAAFPDDYISFACVSEISRARASFNKISSVMVVSLKALRQRRCDEQDNIICYLISLSTSPNSQVADS